MNSLAHAHTQVKCQCVLEIKIRYTKYVNKHEGRSKGFRTFIYFAVGNSIYQCTVL